MNSPLQTVIRFVAVEWRDVLDEDGYEVHPEHGVRRKRDGVMLASRDAGRGVVEYNVRKRRRPLHRLVCEAWHGPQPDGKPLVRHLNGDPTDNHPDNLAWGTHKENGADAVAHGAVCKGERHASSKLTKAKVVEARRSCWTRADVREMASRFGVTPHCLIAAINGRTWKHVEEPPHALRRPRPKTGLYHEPEPHKPTKWKWLPRAQVIEMRRLFALGVSQRELADMFGRHQSQVSRIVRHESYERET